MSISKATTCTTYSFHAGREEERERGREEPLFSPPDIFFNSWPFKAEF